MTMPTHPAATGCSPATRTSRRTRKTPSPGRRTIGPAWVPWSDGFAPPARLRPRKGGRAFNRAAGPRPGRDRSGRTRFGQSMLLARRLVEAGVSLVQVNWTRWDYDTADNPAWDTHSKNAERLKNDLMPPMDL